ncbi:MAG: ATP-binding protein, partial [Legionellales bacterium]|nr:ATP-binding protein [Legionellales bacterium]
NVTQIMVRKHVVTRWRGLFQRSLVDELVRQSGEIDVYIMTGEVSSQKQESTHKRTWTPWKSYAIAVMVTTIATLFNLMLYPYLAGSNLVMVYLLSLVLIARLGQVGLSVIFSIISVSAYDFFFVPPFYSFNVANIEYGITSLVMLLVGQIISYLTILTRRQAAMARLLQYQTMALYTLSRQLTKTRGVDKLLELGVNYIAQAFASDVVALLPVKNNLEIQFANPDKQRVETKEMSIAQWVFEVGQRAGLGTDTLAFSKALYLPLLAAEGILGVLRIQPRTKQLLTPEQMTLLDSCVHQLALALEVDHMQEKSQKKEIKIKTERAKIALLEAISNDLKMPLKRILDALTTLKTYEDEKLHGITKEMDFEVDTLNQINNNIIRIIQLETKDIKLEKTPTSLNIVIHCVIDISSKALKGRDLRTHIPKNLPLVPLNEGLIQQVMFNLLDNAMKFTPVKSSITIAVHQESGTVVVSVEDQGPGVVLDEREKLFEKFYRGKQLTTVRGLGLGLAICHKIIHAHGGNIWVENLEKKGAAFRFSLPLK